MSGRCRRGARDARPAGRRRDLAALVARTIEGTAAAVWSPRTRVERPGLPDGPALVAGLGVAGLAAARALAANRAGPVRAWTSDRFPPSEEDARSLRAAGVEIVLDSGGAGTLDLEPRPEWVAKSPGLTDDHPLVAAAVERGMPVIDEAEVGWRLDSRPFVGVTGTNGKSTVCTLIAAILERHGTRAVVAGNKERAPALSSLAETQLAQAVVAEISSFQLRHSPTLLPEIGVFTNCTQDSWHRHGGPEGYAADKRRLFVRDGRCAPAAGLNVDDPLGEALARDVELRRGRVVRYGVGAEADCRLVRSEWDLRRGVHELAVPGGRLRLQSRLPGTHNGMNVAAALAFALLAEIPVETAAAAVEGAEPVPGRLEPVDEGQPFDVLVDFAHNPDGLRRALGTVKAALGRRGRGRLIVVASALPVFDDAQYGEMGRVVAAVADVVVATSERLTADAPAEWPPAFFAALRESRRDVIVVPDRREAIGHAVAGAQPGDAVVIVGRGIRRHPIYGAGNERFCPEDREDARRALHAPAR